MGRGQSSERGKPERVPKTYKVHRSRPSGRETKRDKPSGMNRHEWQTLRPFILGHVRAALKSREAELTRGNPRGALPVATTLGPRNARLLTLPASGWRSEEESSK